MTFEEDCGHMKRSFLQSDYSKALEELDKEFPGTLKDDKFMTVSDFLESLPGDLIPPLYETVADEAPWWFVVWMIAVPVLSCVAFYFILA